MKLKCIIIEATKREIDCIHNIADRLSFVGELPISTRDVVKENSIPLNLEIIITEGTSREWKEFNTYAHKEWAELSPDERRIMMMLRATVVSHT